MNRIILMGRLTRDPEVRYGGANNTAVARYSIAVDRRFKREGEPDADFFNLVSFAKQGEFVEKYLRKGTKIVVEGELRNNNYTNKDGQMVYNVEIVTSNVEFAESKSAQANSGFVAEAPAPNTSAGDGFMNIPNGIDEELPFN
ncbi:MAG: single-stranded DNA-binding protein [Lachnospiraceae bacterium]|nr:single-stranded DNA-binding protein [Lachnospiraceae bacterium]MDD6191594.1 single-stranded DNA-binding protein [Lachnospiraceae bacterium]MDY4793460.1 single-stranded DNA-binding protein [Pararoseburia sp.]